MVRRDQKSSVGVNCGIKSLSSLRKNEDKALSYSHEGHGHEVGWVQGRLGILKCSLPKKA